MTLNMSLFAETLPVTYRDSGKGRPFLLLHGGAGPGSMMVLAKALATNSRAIIPTYPGFEGQPRPDWFHRIADLTLMQLALIERLDLEDVVIVGNSVGGWLAAEIGLRGSGRIAQLVLINAVGLDPTPEAGGIVDPASLAPAELLAHSFHDPARAIRPTDADAVARMAANQRTLRVYAGEPFMHDPALRSRLPGVDIPTLVLWGASDRIVTPAYGRQYADLVPGARFEIVAEAGHLPQIEQPERVCMLVKGGS